MNTILYLSLQTLQFFFLKADVQVINGKQKGGDVYQGSGGRLRPSAGSGQSPDRGLRGG